MRPTVHPSIHRNTIGDALQRIAMRSPEQIALQYRERRWSFLALDRAANRVANHLLALGLSKADRVAAYGKNSDAYLILWLACTRAGLYPCRPDSRSGQLLADRTRTGLRTRPVGRPRPFSSTTA
jgi:fatty-acyl-CoA synthase